MQILLRGGRLVDEKEVFQADLLIEGEKIRSIAQNIPDEELQPDCQVLDVAGMLIMPGMIDAHTHYQLSSRDTVTADDFLSGSIAAALGGVTTFIDYADHQPDCTLPEGIQARIDEAQGKAVVDFSLHQTITHFDSKVAQEMADLLQLGVSSIKIFTTYRREGYMIPEQEWEQVFRRLKDLELLVTVHGEDDGLIMELEKQHQEDGLLTPAMHPRIRPVESEKRAVNQIGELAMDIGIPVYIAHLSSQAGLEALRQLRRAGGKIYAETTPHYLLLDDSYLSRDDAQLYLMTPPLRKSEDQQALWEGLNQNLIQVVATDHCAFHREEKLADDNCLTILPGIPGTETLLPLVHHYGVVERHWSYPRLVQVLATNPAKIFGLYPEKGSLQLGTDADLVVFDPTQEMILSNETLHSRAGYSAYEGFALKGYPVMTFLRGQLIAEKGRFIGQPGQGRFVAGTRSVLFEPTDL